MAFACKQGKKFGTLAFTLTELLVTLLAIAVLAALLFPVYFKGVKSAQKVQCASNLRQLAMANLLYAAEQGQGRVTVGSKNPRYWWMVLRPYLEREVKNDDLAKVMLCPSDKEKGGVNNTAVLLRRSYAVNYNLVSNNDVVEGTVAYMTVAIQRPLSKVIMMIESDWWKIGSNFVYPASPDSLATLPMDRHDGSVNAAFMDGHIESLDIKSLYPGKENAELFNLR